MAAMLLRRFQTKRDGPGEVVSIHAAGEGVLQVLQSLIEVAPRKRDGFDLHVALALDASKDHTPLTRSVLVRAVVQEQVALMSLNVEAGAERPCSFSEHVGQGICGCHGTDAMNAMLMHHRRRLRPSVRP